MRLLVLMTHETWRPKYWHLGFIRTLSGWCLTYPSEKYESQLGNVGILIPYMKWKIIQPCLKPPTRWFFNAILDDGIPCYQYLIPHMLMVLGIWWSNWLEYSWAPNVGFPNDPAATLRLSQPQTTAAGCWWSAASWPQSAHGAPHVGAVAVHAENLSC